MNIMTIETIAVYIVLVIILFDGRKRFDPRDKVDGADEAVLALISENSTEGPRERRASG